ncbi:glycosyltransferase family 25 protein [Durotheca rogersii]|uniref:glycosyltransferase family 25 protein n=1 Tax=Durotheca rogersii TaxID=419775 RepID=UPI002220FC91|nr:glycosyltransferase family 25 protein [Durotheca rogersii]KAI5863208.1 glycosyltransferase family 25 protein [Durotheca rogersii]
MGFVAILASARRLCNLTAIAISAVLFLLLYLLSSNARGRGSGGSSGGGFAYFNAGKPSSSAPKITEDIFNSTLGFEKILVVNLPSRTDRRDGIVLGAALSDLEIEFVDGVDGKLVPDKALPTSPDHDRLPDAVIGSWRGHMNAIQEVVRRNLSSALILEDDADWDVRIKTQLRDFALAAHALTQPLAGGGPARFADATYPGGLGDRAGLPASVPELAFDALPATVAPAHSPYGDGGWDVLWLGHCGMRFPEAADAALPKGRVVRAGDATVPQPRHLWTLTAPDGLRDGYANHTRVVHHARDGVCSLAYAVSRRGARRLLHALGLRDLRAAFDIELRWFCDAAGGRAYHPCLAVQPALFHIHLRAGPKASNSDISDHGAGHQHAVTRLVRYSVRMNAEALADGRADLADLVDQWPDAE